MSLKDILVHIDDADYAATCIAVAAALAVDHSAELTGLYVRPAVELPVLAQNVAGDGLADALLHAADRAAERARTLFENGCSAAGAPHTWLDTRGDVPDTLIAHARTCDLAVVGPTGNDQPSVRRVSGQVVLGSGTPVLVVPERSSATTLGQRVLIAWNASPECVRAVRGALPILKRAAAVEILVVLAALPNADAPGQPGQRLVHHLKRHDVAATVKMLTLEDSYGVSGAVLARAAAIDADLIVMGGFGRSRLREALVGSTTGTLMSRSPVPLLVSH